MEDGWLEDGPGGGGREEGELQVGRDQALPARQFTPQSQQLACQKNTIKSTLKKILLFFKKKNSVVILK